MATLIAAMPPGESEDGAGSGATRERGTEPPATLGPLPSGRHHYSAEQVAAHQRERLIAGLATVVAERGYAAATIGEIAAAAHVSRRVFYEHFETKDDCFLAAFDVIFEHLETVVVAAAAPFAGDWPRQVVASLRATLAFFASRRYAAEAGEETS